MDWFRLTLTFPDPTPKPKTGEKLLDAFVGTHPEVGPVVSQDTEAGKVSVTIALAAADASEAVKESVPLFIEGLMATDLRPLEALELSVSTISDEEQAEVRELETA